MSPIPSPMSLPSQLSLSNVSYGVSLSFSQFFLLATILPVFVRFILNSVSPPPPPSRSLSLSLSLSTCACFTFRSSFSLCPQISSLYLTTVSPRRGKDRFIFYYSSCLSDMFRAILRLCSSLRPAKRLREIYFASSIF